MTTMRPFSRWRTARRRIHGSATWSIWIADMTRANNPSFPRACWTARTLLARARGQAPESVAAAGGGARLDPERVPLVHFLRQPGEDLVGDAVPGFAGE